MNVKDLLPIGSIVLLKDGQKTLMITGVMQRKPEKDSKTFDYVGVLYPEGYMGNRFQFLFNHDNIDQIVFRGYEDQARLDFLEKLAGYYHQ